MSHEEIYEEHEYYMAAIANTAPNNRAWNRDIVNECVWKRM